MYISDFKLVDILRDKMGEDEARMLVEYIETRVEDKFLDAQKVFATKEDLLKLEMRIQETAHKYHLEMQKLISDSKADIFKWMFGMIVTASIAIIGTILSVMQMGGWGR